MSEAKKCKIENCKRPYRAKDYCNVHYKKWRHGEFKKARYKTCVNETCRKPMFQKGLCEPHYKALVAGKKGAETTAPVASAAPAPAEASPAS